MKRPLFVFAFILTCLTGWAQKNDSAAIRRKAFESSVFFNTDTLTSNDYLLKIGKVLQVLNTAPVLSQPKETVLSIQDKLNNDDTILNIIKDRLSTSERALRVRNLEMYNILLAQIQKNTQGLSTQLDEYDSTTDAYRSEVAAIVKDTLLRRVFRDPALRSSFQSQINDLRGKWKKADSIVRQMNLLISTTQAHASNNLIAINELQVKASQMTETIGSRAFGKERRYLWEQRIINPRPNGQRRFNNNIENERKITRYYFSHTHFKINLLLLCGIIFFLWVFFNFKILKRKNQLSALEQFHFRYLYPLPFFASFIFMLNLAPLFDLNAPAVYTEFIGLLLMIILTVSFTRRLPKKIFYLWLFFIALFILSFSTYLRLPFYLNRWISFILNCASFVLGLFAWLKYRKEYSNRKLLIATVFLYMAFNFLAVVSNLFGRVTLMQIFSSSSIFLVIQTVALIIFARSVTESVILQIQRSRMTKGYSPAFDFSAIRKGVLRIAVFCSLIIWLIVFATNLNLYNIISQKIGESLSKPRVIGSFSFSLGGLLLFLFIMWAANFLQKYIGYFFGDVGDEMAINNKSHRSRLLITRLLLLVGGFLLAVAASGLPVDRITVILGALGVGIGLGLQGIVNNLVSGIILIFDRTLRIGDTVQIGDKKGRVKEISVRSSTLMIEDGAEVIIPNGDILSHNIVNWTLSSNNVRLDIGFTIDRLVLPDTISEWFSEITQSMKETFVHSMQLKAYLWCTDVSKTDLARTEVLTALYKKLQGQGIKIL